MSARGTPHVVLKPPKGASKTQSDRNLNWDWDFEADYITVVKDRSIMSVKYCIPVPVF